MFVPHSFRGRSSLVWSSISQSGTFPAVCTLPMTALGRIQTSLADKFLNAIPTCHKPGQRSPKVLVAMTPQITQWLAIGYVITWTQQQWTGSNCTNPFTLMQLKGDHDGFGSDQWRIINGSIMASLISSAGHTSCSHSTHIGLSPHATSMSQFFYCYLSHGPIQHHSAQLDREAWTKRGGFYDYHGNTFLIVFNWGNHNSSFNVLCVEDRKPSIPSKCNICFMG